ncbi:uncharacterized protein FOMMEDRAFT_153556 [Fomitiporia mediterranea MF3/22]|uniref:uncharacterized protein n=1 Tax=Fomitiporia mediterranea (strain MF3/22) TaxID=694068 RepID=UPI0004409345|nr:uncharacterized protein FOMMEDRAFT_153556 [Fomitiporia mediterranea MF3/22]EJD06158.1 hypothetical protein FOMMEDRAFT_153556 [Fomitiporia mediterranea MF3/22]
MVEYLRSRRCSCCRSPAPATTISQFSPRATRATRVPDTDANSVRTLQFIHSTPIDLVACLCPAASSFIHYIYPLSLLVIWISVMLSSAGFVLVRNAGPPIGPRNSPLAGSQLLQYISLFHNLIIKQISFVLALFAFLRQGHLKKMSHAWPLHQVRFSPNRGFSRQPRTGALTQ